MTKIDTMTSMTRRLSVALITILLAVGFAQTTPNVEVASETGYVSGTHYANAFFGFLLPLPQEAGFKDFVTSSTANSQFLFGLQAQQNGLTAMTVIAFKSENNTADEAQKLAAGPEKQRTRRVEIGGRGFWKAEAENKTRAGKMRSVTYATSMKGYTLQFAVVSFDAKLYDGLVRSIESLSFIDPTQAKTMAGEGARPFLTSTTGSSKRIEQLKTSVISGNVLTNQTLGFSFQFPDGWALADKETQHQVVEAGHQRVWGDAPAAAREHEAVERCSKVLLWASKYPEGTKTAEVNPLVAVIAFDSSCMPGVSLPKSANDTDGIRQTASQIAQALSGTPFMGKGQNTIRALSLQNRLMLDLSSAFKVDVQGSKQPLDVFTSVIFTEDKGYWVMWMFMTGSQSGLDDLRRDVKIVFTPANPEQK